MNAAQQENFQVDLTGMVDLLSKHLYSGPQVYIRELLQNGVDAITAARELEPATPAQVWFRVLSAEHTLEVYDSGVGLSQAQARELLATIGRSSKRDADLGFGRAEFLGQFGIGMLAAFMVADEITVVSQSRVPDATGLLPAPIRWTGNANGTFQVTEISPAEVPELIRDGGSLVRVSARLDTAHWVNFNTVRSLAKNYGELLPLKVVIANDTGAAMGELTWERITRPVVPWQEEYLSPQLRESALTDYCEQAFGFKPLAAIDLAVPTLGISGVAFILPQPVTPGSGQHRVYLKQMLLGERIDKILPEWAFFTRAVLTTDSLSPTASREQLHDDERLQLAREALGEALKLWIRTQLETLSEVGVKFLEVHHLALRAVGAQDTEMLELIAESVPFESTEGPLTLKQAAAGGEVLYTGTVEDYKRAQAVARAAGITVVNAGYAYDLDLIKKLQGVLGWQTRELAQDDLTAALETPDLERETATANALAHARTLLEAADCDVLLRKFSPATLPAMLLQDREAEFQKTLREQQEETPDLWDGLLASFTEQGSNKSRTLVLNDNAPVVHTLLDTSSATVFEAGLMALYISAVALSGEGLKGSETNVLSASLETLLSAALAGGAPGNNAAPDAENS